MSVIRSYRFDGRPVAEGVRANRTVEELRELASWYRQFADRAGNPAIWEARLVTAQELEEEADRLEADRPAFPVARRAS